MTAACHHRRIALLKDILRKNSLDSILITDHINVEYLSGFPGHDPLMLITLDKDYFITDSRYAEEAGSCLTGLSVRLVEISTYDTISGIIKADRLKRVGFESMNLSYGVAYRFNELLDSAKFIPCKDIVETLRSVKDDSEIRLIRDSVLLNMKIFGRLHAMVSPGVREKAIAAAAETAFIESGAKAAFDPIIASAENASKPHARPTDSKVKNNSFVMIDIGARLKGYCSDYTRMVTLGRVKDKYVRISAIVKDAHDKAIDKIRAGVKMCDIDAAGRGYIDKMGYGKYFGHSIGHGVGMGIHEKPTVSRANDTRALPGMVFTIEPAIYIPNFGGVRIEDMVLVTEKGCEVITGQ